MRIAHISVIVLSALGYAVLPTSNAAAQSAPACEPGRLAEKYPSLVGKTIKIGQDGETPPFSIRNPENFEELIGLDADMAREVFSCAGVPVEFVTGAWSGLIPAVIAGQIDVMWDSLLYTPERAKGIDFVYYMTSATSFLVAKGNPKNIHGVGDLCGVAASAPLGSTQEAMLREASSKCSADGKEAINIITASDIPASVRLVATGRADTVATDQFLADVAVKADPNIESAFSQTTSAKTAAGVTKGNADLVKAIYDGLVTLRANGKLEEIYGKYGVDYKLAVPPQILTE